ncbi:MAG TPA: 3-oxoacyl-ACP reductase FabG [Gammaproteobacteria bacterium]|nr:3-oxoacyl-ACP reductase FabG [Gammaproteobacteria bacterium]
MLHLTSLEDKIAFVTGANRGIGLAIATTLGKLGATVIGTGINEEAKEEFSQHFEKQGLKGFGVVLDVREPKAIQAITEKITQDVGGPTILINNAGITRDNLLIRMKDEDWDIMIQTNLSSAYHMAKACVRHMMKERWGRIVNISSVVGVAGNAGQTNYAAAKAGLLGLTKSLAKEVGTRGITVNAVAPGFIDTAMTQGLTDAQRELLLQQIPMGRLGQPQEIANAVGFLASNEAAYITGQTLHVNGGMFMS